MGSFRDRAAIEAGMQTVLTGDLPFIEAGRLLFAGQDEASTRKMAFDFLKAHFDTLAAKRPSGGGSDFGADFPEVGGSYCDSGSKAELQSFFQSRIDQFTGGPRMLAQVLESIDLCIATKAAQDSSVAAFLEKY